RNYGPFICRVGDAVQDAGLVVDVHDKCMDLNSYAFFSREGTKTARQSAPVSTSGDGRRIILCRSAPAGTIGYTESSCSTWKSMTAVRGCRRAESTAAATSPRLVTVADQAP